MKQLGVNEVQSCWTDVCLKPATGGTHIEYIHTYLYFFHYQASTLINQGGNKMTRENLKLDLTAKCMSVKS